MPVIPNVCTLQIIRCAPFLSVFYIVHHGTKKRNAFLALQQTRMLKEHPGDGLSYRNQQHLALAGFLGQPIGLTDGIHGRAGFLCKLPKGVGIHGAEN